MMMMMMTMMKYLPGSSQPGNDTQPSLIGRGADHVTTTSPMTSARRRPRPNGIGQRDRAT